MLAFLIVIATFVVIAVSLLVRYEKPKCRRDRPEQTYVSRTIAGMFIIVSILLGCMALIVKPVENADDKQLVAAHITPDIQSTIGGLNQTGRLQQSTITGEITKDVFIYGTFPDTQIQSSEVLTRTWTTFAFLGLAGVVIVWAYLFYNQADIKRYSARSERDREYWNSAERVYPLCAFFVCAWLVLTMFMAPFVQVFFSEQISVGWTYTVATNSENTNTVIVSADNTERIYYNAENLYQAFHALDTTDRRFALNYDPQTDTLHGIAEVVVH